MSLRRGDIDKRRNSQKRTETGDNIAGRSFESSTSSRGVKFDARTYTMYHACSLKNSGLFEWLCLSEKITYEHETNVVYLVHLCRTRLQWSHVLLSGHVFTCMMATRVKTDKIALTRGVMRLFMFRNHTYIFVA